MLETLLDDHLCRVSENFCAVIRALRPPHREWIALSYLLLRILDTIEDSQWADPVAQEESFARFEAFLSGPLPKDEVDGWARSFPASLTVAERHLILGSHDLLVQSHALPPKALDIVRRTVVTMAAGMKMFLRKEKPLESIAELNLYCFFVAGLVAELLVDLLALISGCLEVDLSFILGARNFGVALQKVNILNDMEVDVAAGRRFVRSPAEVLDSLGPNVRLALSFFARIPDEEREFRFFCQYSLLGALASLPPGVGGGAAARHTTERSRLFETIAEVGHDPGAIEALTRELCPRLWHRLGSESEPPLETTWLQEATPEEASSALRSYFAQTPRA